MNFIINPLTNKKHSIFSKTGKNLLKQYVKLIQRGGVWEHKTPYEALGINPEATQDDIKNAYRQLALQWHPDKNLENVTEATKKFKEITAANVLLKDPRRKRNFDSEYELNGYSDTEWPTERDEQTPMQPRQQRNYGYNNYTQRTPGRRTNNPPPPPPEAFYTQMNGTLGQTFAFVHYVSRNPVTDMFIRDVLKYRRPLYEAGMFSKVLRFFAQSALSLQIVNLPFYLYIPLYLTLLNSVALNSEKEQGYVSFDRIDYILLVTMTFCLFTYLDENGEATMLHTERCGYIEGLTDEEIKNITPVEGFRQQVICNVYYLIEILANILFVFVKIVDFFEPSLLYGGSLDAINNNELISFKKFKSFRKEDWLSYFDKARNDKTNYGKKNENFIENINNSYKKINKQMQDNCKEILDELRKTAKLYLTEEGRKKKNELVEKYIDIINNTNAINDVTNDTTENLNKNKSKSRKSKSRKSKSKKSSSKKSKSKKSSSKKSK